MRFGSPAVVTTATDLEVWSVAAERRYADRLAEPGEGTMDSQQSTTPMVR